MKPVLSICIPTYNRSGYLYLTLKSIVEQDIFKNSNEIEVVISDNCSTDFTEQISKIFVGKFPDKIMYNKNETNICDENFAKVLTLAHGEVLKLHNDNFLFKEDSLEKIVCEIKNQRDKKPLIFFSNGNSRTNDSRLCKNMNDFVETASYLTTWIASFSIWKEDFDNFKNFDKNVHTQLMQTDALFRLISDNKKILVFNDSVFYGQNVLKKGGYNIAKVFGQNYLSLLKPYLKTGQLDKKVYENEKKVLLLNHIIPMKFSTSVREKDWNFNNNGYCRFLIKDYWYNFYFYASIIEILRLIIDVEINLVSKKLNKNSYQKYWRKRNKHNNTTISKNVDVTKVFAGKNVEGHIDAKFSEDPNELLIIDNNAIIDENTVFDLTKEKIIILKANNSNPIIIN